VVLYLYNWSFMSIWRYDSLNEVSCGSSLVGRTDLDYYLRYHVVGSLGFAICRLFRA